MECAGASRQSPNDTPWETLHKKTPHISRYPHGWSGYLRTPVTGQGTCAPLSLVRVPAHPCHWSGYLRTPVTGQDICIPLSLVKVPAYPWPQSGHLHTPDSCSGYLYTPYAGQGSEGTCVPLTLVRIWMKEKALWYCEILLLMWCKPSALSGFCWVFLAFVDSFQLLLTLHEFCRLQGSVETRM